jgi:single-stranded-DNA-specific exonuclease
LDILTDRIPAFRAAFNREARARLESTDLRPVLSPDLEVTLDDLSEDLFRLMRHLGPHGIGNPRPVFLLRGATLPQGAREVGSGHIKTRLRHGTSELEAIGFRLAERLPPETLGRGPVDALFHLQENEYRGRRTLQASLRDLRPADPQGRGGDR